MPNKVGCMPTDFVRHSFLGHENLIFLNAVLRIACPVKATRQDYGQNAGFGDLPVNSGSWLRPKHTFNVAYTNKVPDEICQLTANHPGLLLETWFFPGLFYDEVITYCINSLKSWLMISRHEKMPLSYEHLKMAQFLMPRL